MYYVLGVLYSFLSVLSASSDYKVFDESGSLVGSFPYKTQLIQKRDIVTPPSRTVIAEDDHTYYKSQVIKNSSAWIEINPQHSQLDKNTLHEGLSAQFRYAYNIPLTFTFPFYGLPLRSITPTTGGFIFVGELIHNQLTATQYIAPLMAEFNPSHSNESKVFYHMTDSFAVVQWDNVHVNSNFSSENGTLNKPFTFQAQLYKNGDVIFAYKDVPYGLQAIDDRTHHVKVGISEAFYEIDVNHGITITYIHEYHKIEIEFENIGSNTEVHLLAEPTCVSAMSCAACSTVQTAFNCTWCPTIQQCSDGMSRWKQNWVDARCNNPGKSVSKKEECPSETVSALPTSTKKGAYEMVLCQESKTAIVCAGDDKLTIVEASFSRMNYMGSACESPRSSTGNTQCAYDNKLVKEKVSESCNDKSKCFIHAAQTFFGSDPCPESDKTLNIYYKCNGSNTGTKALVGFIITLVLIVVMVFVAWVFYAYRNPTTPSGLWLIKYGRFWKSRAYKEDTAESGI